jgi:hypothetical protein
MGGEMMIWALGLQFQSLIRPEAWALLALVPAGIILLYFLKLRRRPVQVPSTLLWRRSLEDLHVNSLFQRLRRNLLLFLQLLVVGLVMLALAGPRSEGLGQQGKRLVLAIDESASMAATDVSPSRLEQALLRAKTVIDEMRPGDVAMIIAFADSARVVTNYTEDKGELLRRLRTITPTHGSTSLREALQLVAGLANPQKYLEGEGVQSASVVPPKLFLFTDGGFPDVEGFSLGTIEPEVVAIGPRVELAEGRSPAGPGGGEGESSSPSSGGDSEPGAAVAAPIFAGPASDNLAILALSTAGDEGRPDQFQVFGRVRNHRPGPVSTRAVLHRHDPARPGEPGPMIDAVALDLSPRSDQAFQFDLKADSGYGEFEVDLEEPDALPLDNHAFTVVTAPRRARVLLVSAGNRFLTDTLTTQAAAQIAEVTSIRPEQLQVPDQKRDLQAGRYDLVIFDGVSPETLPEASTLFFGVLPPDIPADQSRPVTSPVIVDWDLSHPILQYVRDLGTVAVRKALAMEPPAAAKVLIESDQGSLAFARARGPFLDVVLGFGLLDGEAFNTTWPLKSGFPLFVFNSLRVLGNARDSGGSDRDLFSPDQPIALRIDTAAEQIEVLGPDGRKIETCRRSSQGTFVVTQAHKTGIYHAHWSDRPEDRLAFAVNLFNPRESNLAPRGQVPPGLTDAQADAYRIKIGFTPVQAARLDAPSTREWWWLVALAALGLVVVEWFVYTRRVHI